VSVARLLGGLLHRWLERFDDEPTMLPSAEALPREVPRIILNSRTSVWRCEIASARINLFWRRAPGATAIGIEEFFREALPLLTAYRDFLDARVGRIAAVLNRFARHPAPGLFLARHFCRERWLTGPLNRPESFELHAHKRFELSRQLPVNSWVRAKTGRLGGGDGDATPIVLVEQDLNTVPEEAPTRAFTIDEIRHFFEATTEEFDTILALYFPMEEG